MFVIRVSVRELVPTQPLLAVVAGLSAQAAAVQPSTSVLLLVVVDGSKTKIDGGMRNIGAVRASEFGFLFSGIYIAVVADSREDITVCIHSLNHRCLYLVLMQISFLKITKYETKI
jgi:hypothetical protein